MLQVRKRPDSCEGPLQSDASSAVSPSGSKHRFCLGMRISLRGQRKRLPHFEPPFPLKLVQFLPSPLSPAGMVGTRPHDTDKQERRCFHDRQARGTPGRAYPGLAGATRRCVLPDGEQQLDQDLASVRSDKHRLRPIGGHGRRRGSASCNSHRAPQRGPSLVGLYLGPKVERV